jgi:short-subunit dehydrogenase
MCKNVFDQILKKLKKIDVSIFSTGIHDPESEKNFNLSKIREIMEVNYFGTINSINSVYEYFKEKKSGHISIISSVAGYRGLPAAGGYCSSKAALTTYAESLFFDLQRYNVRVSVVSPGFIKTPMTDKNSFKMPMLKSVDFAAEEIFKGLTKSNSFEIHFPKTFTIIMKIVKCLPDFIYFKISKFGMKYIGG